MLADWKLVCQRSSKDQRWFLCILAYCWFFYEKQCRYYSQAFTYRSMSGKVISSVRRKSWPQRTREHRQKCRHLGRCRRNDKKKIKKNWGVRQPESRAQGQNLFPFYSFLVRGFRLPMTKLVPESTHHVSHTNPGQVWSFSFMGPAEYTHTPVLMFEQHWGVFNAPVSELFFPFFSA